MPAATAKKAAERAIRSLEKQGFSQYEIGRRTGVSRGHIYNVLSGRAGLSEERASSVLSSLRADFRVAILRDYGTVWMEPANKRQYGTIGSHWRAIQTAREKGDWSGLKRFRRAYVTVIDKRKKVRLKLLDDRDQAAIRELEDRHQLEPVEVTRGGSQLSPRSSS